MRPIARGGLPQVAGAGFLLLLATAPVSSAPAGRLQTADCATDVRSEEPSRPAPCCFVNPSYAGVCVVHPTKDETCASVLAYLNNPQSTGKSYCNSTATRGNWRQVVCERSPEPQGTQ